MYRQYHANRKKDDKNNDLQSTTQKTKDWTTITRQQPGVISGAPEG